MKIIRTRRELEQFAEELREADRKAGPSPTSRDWFRCGTCYLRDESEAGCRAWPEPVGEAEWWHCPRCTTLWAVRRDATLIHGLTRWQWSVVRHLSCGAFGHNHCLPDVWLNQLVVSDGGRVLESPQLGRLELRWGRPS